MLGYALKTIDLSLIDAICMTFKQCMPCLHPSTIQDILAFNAACVTNLMADKERLIAEGKSETLIRFIQTTRKAENRKALSEKTFIRYNKLLLLIVEAQLATLQPR